MGPCANTKSYKNEVFCCNCFGVIVRWFDQLLRVQAMPLYPFIIGMFYFFFVRNPECPFANRHIGHKVLTEIPYPDIVSWCREIVSIGSKKL